MASVILCSTVLYILVSVIDHRVESSQHDSEIGTFASRIQFNIRDTRRGVKHMHTLRRRDDLRLRVGRLLREALDADGRHVGRRRAHFGLGDLQEAVVRPGVRLIRLSHLDNGAMQTFGMRINNINIIY